MAVASQVLSSGRSFVVALACSALLAPNGAGGEWHSESNVVMGTAVSVDLWTEDRVLGERLVDQVMAEFRRIDRLMSTYKADSELSRVNRQAAQEPVVVSGELFGIVGLAIELSRLSNGAFDVTYESVGYLYDFRARRRPTADQIGKRLEAIDFRSVSLVETDRTISFGRPGMRINLGGIAKGYAVERAAGMLAAEGIRHAVLSAGGDSRMIGDRRGQPWVIGIRHPRDENKVVTRLPLVDEAISTSGDYERFFEEGDQRFHHIIDPSTGQPSRGVRSATVIGPDATWTDALSTSIFVLGLEEGLALVERLEAFEAIVVDAAGSLHYSSGLTTPEQP